MDNFAKKLKLSARLAKKIGLRHLSSEEARKELGFGVSLNSTKDYSGIAFEGYDLRGEHRGVYQVRRDNPELNEHGKPENKYVSRPKSVGERWVNTTPGALKPKDTVYVVEGPKSTWAVSSALERLGQRNYKVVDTNGLDGWLVKPEDESQPSYPNPDLLALAGHKVVLLPDSNAVRDDLKPKVVKFESFLTEIGCAVKVGRIPAIVNGPDDLILEKNGDALLRQVIERAQPLWQYEFPAVSEFNDEELKADLLVDHLVGNHTLTILASPSENYKSTFAMVLSRSLLTGDDAFACDKFRTNATVPGVLYCCPDMSHEMTLIYARKFGLHEGNCVGRFRIRTMKQGEILGPDNPLLKQAARAGWFIVFDTLNYFTDADDDNNPQQLNKFVVKCRKLIDQHGASGLMMLAHPTKTGARSNEVDVTEWVSGTYAKIGSVDTIFCMKKLTDESGTPVAVWVGREKSRPFLGVRLDPFKLALLDGKGSTIDRGELPVSTLEAGALSKSLPKKNQGGAQSHPKKPEMMKFIRGFIKDRAGKRNKTVGRMEILKALNDCPDFNPPDPKTGKKNGCGVTDRTIGNWLKEDREDKKNIGAITEEEQ